jgi:histidinol phosphatase-like enzyme
MQQPSNHLIHKLRSLPRHGQEEPGGGGPLGPKKLGALYGNLTKQLKELTGTEAARSAGISKLIGFQQRLNKLYLDQIDAMTKLEQRNAVMQKQFGLTTKEAAKFGFRLDKLSTELGYGRTNIDKYIKGLDGLTSGYIRSTKISSKVQKSLINQHRYFTDLVGVTSEAANATELFYAGQTTGEKTVAKQMEKIVLQRKAEFELLEKKTGIQGIEKTVTEEIAKTNSSNLMTFQRYPSQIGLAVMKSKALGVTMNDIAKVGDKLLDIESSVGAEMELQLLTGKRMVDDQGKSLTNKFREQYLAGKSADATQTLNKMFDKQGKTLETNMLARQAFAKATGLEVDQVTKIVQKRKLLKGLGAEKLFDVSGEELKKELENINVKEEDIKKIMDADDRRTTQQRSAEALETIVDKGIMLQMGTETGAGEFAANVKTTIEDQLIPNLGKAFTDKDSGFYKFLSQNAKNVGDTFIDQLTIFGSDQNPVYKEIKTFASALGGTTTMATEGLETFIKAIKKITPNFVKKAFTGGLTGVANMTVPQAEVVNVNKHAMGGIVPPGYPNDTYPAALTSGETIVPAGQSPAMAGGITPQQMANMFAAAVASHLSGTKLKVDAGDDFRMNSGRYS